MSTLVLSRDLTSADDGTGTWTVTATDADGQSASITIAFTISAPTVQQAPMFSGWPQSVALMDNATAGSMVAEGSITNNDGSAFSGNVVVVDQAGNTAPLTFQA